MVGSKFEAKSKQGVHQLFIKKLEMNDEDTYEIETGGLKGSCKLTVQEGKKNATRNSCL